MLLMLQAISVEISRVVTAVVVFCIWIWIAVFLKMKIERGIKWIGNQIRKRRNSDTIHKKRQK